jgi:hypothetical protein
MEKSIKQAKSRKKGRVHHTYIYDRKGKIHYIYIYDRKERTMTHE